ncbi:hypothetical protein MWG58_28985 [Streptomyces sp. WAC00276]|uniref:hypothetical protein n=1 Tax=Streptomyces sp. WAC00276 TaxID=2933778 RepID=UPI001FFE8ACC|nr:hypothetical protein [Streptomyces sp. WAC00276]MCK2144880.1 hypothetical protein [Streptomyces sp. WAC00276]
MTNRTRAAGRCTIFLGATVLLAYADRPWAASPPAVLIAAGLAAAAGHWIASDDDTVAFLYAAAPIGVPIVAGLLLASLVAGWPAVAAALTAGTTALATRPAGRLLNRMTRR